MGDTKISYDEKFGINNFRSEICAALGDEFWETLTEGLTLPDIETEGKCQCRNMCEFMRRFEEMAEKETVRSILCKVRHGLCPSQSSWAREEFLQIGDLACEYEITIPDDIMAQYVTPQESKTVIANYYRYYKAFGLSGIIDLHEGSVDWMMPKEGKVGPSLAFNVQLSKDHCREELQELIAGIKAKTIPNRWFITPDAEPENIIELLEANGFKNLSENAEQPEPGMLLWASDFTPCLQEENPAIVCREVQTLEDFTAWVDVVNTALHGWEMIDAENYYTWTKQENMRFYLAELDGKAISTVATIRTGNTASLEFVSTLQEYRRRKAAIILSSRALENLFAAGVESVTLSGSGEAVPLYEKLGFHQCFHNIIMLYE